MMSGLCGILALREAQPDEDSLRRMASHLTGSEMHTTVQGRCALATTGDRPPLTTQFTHHANVLHPEDLREAHSVIVFDGNLENHEEVAANLQAYKHRFDGGVTPQEVMIRSYLQFGVDLFCAPFHGQFAAAIWDVTQQRLILCRDHVGQRALYYTITPDWFLFATEIKALTAHPEVSHQPHLTALPFYLSLGYPPPGETMFAGIQATPPGHLLVVEEGKTHQSSFWRPPNPKKPETSWDEAETASYLRDALRSIIIRQIPKEDSFGIFLEGGINSSILLTLLSDVEPERIMSFSTPAPGGLQSDEAVVIRKMRARFTTQHHEITLEVDLPHLLDELLTLYEQPFGDAAGVMAYRLSQSISTHVDSLFVSNGGDELFAGYEDFRIAQIAQQYDRLPDFAQRAIGGAVERLPSRQGFTRRLSQVTQTISQSLPKRYLNWVRLIDLDNLQALIGEKGVEVIDRQYSQYFFDPEPRNMMNALLAISLHTSVPQSQLDRLNHSRLGTGLNIYTPFLDHRLAHFAATLPPSYKLRRGMSRYILRQAFSDVLPRRVLESNKEHGIPTPVDAWFRDDLTDIVDNTLLGDRTLLADLFDTTVVHDMIHAHRSGEQNLGQPLWVIFILEMWMRHQFA